MQFNKDYFSFNNVYSRKYGYKLMTVESDATRVFGVERSLNKEKGVNNEDILYGVENADLTLTVSFCKVDHKDNIIPFNDEELKFIARWFFNKKEYLPFECDGLIYYVIFTKSTAWCNEAGQGYITLDMNVLNGICYEAVEELEKSIIGVDYIYLYNDSTATDIIYPDYEFKLLSGNYFKITNETTGQVATFNNISVGEKIVVDNNIKDMRSETNVKKNIYNLSNKEWLYLDNGRNVLKIEATNCNFKIKYQNKMCLI